MNEFAYTTAFRYESAASGIPVLWLINNDDIIPTWGIGARIKAEEN